MNSFDKLIGMKHQIQLGNANLELEVGSYCTFDELSPSNGVHMHNCYEISYVTKGVGCFVNNDIEIPLIRGSIFIADPHIPHEINIIKSDKSRKLELIYFLFRIHCESNKTTENFNEKLIRAFIEEHSTISQGNTKIANYLEFIHQYDNNNPNDDRILIQIYSMMLLDMIRSLVVLSEDVNSISISSKSMIDIAMIFIRENIERKLWVDEIAKHTGTSTRNLQYLFRKHLNMTIVQYINSRKINLACSYLKMNISVTNVAKMIGIEDVSQFSRLFKSKMGISPKKYQKNYASSGINFAAFTKDDY